MRLAIIGASARAAAFSAVAAGYEVVAADMFGDADLGELCPVFVPTPWPDGLPEWLAAQRVDGWMYVGGMENRANLVADLERIAPLWGTPSCRLPALRDPLLVQAECRRRGIRFPHTQAEPPDSRDTAWLIKPSLAGGMGIEMWSDVLAANARTGVSQQFLADATSWSALFVVSRDSSHCIGLTRQLVGEPWTHAKPFSYCGSLPVESTARFTDDPFFDALGAMLLDLGARGVVGVDLLNHGGQWWLCEINPRYPASAEVLEGAAARSIVDLHVGACTSDSSASVGHSAHHASAAKAILFAPRACHVTPDVHAWLMQRRLRAGGWIADIPAANSTIESGAPLLTVLITSGERPLEVLQARAAEVYRELFNMDAEGG